MSGRRDPHPLPEADSRRPLTHDGPLTEQGGSAGEGPPRGASTLPTRAHVTPCSVSDPDPNRGPRPNGTAQLSARRGDGSAELYAVADAPHSSGGEGAAPTIVNVAAGSIPARPTLDHPRVGLAQAANGEPGGPPGQRGNLAQGEARPGKASHHLALTGDRYPDAVEPYDAGLLVALEAIDRALCDCGNPADAPAGRCADCYDGPPPPWLRESWADTAGRWS